MSGQEIMYAVGFFLMVMGAVWAAWWRIEGRVDRAKLEAISTAIEAQREVDSVSKDLSAFKLHVAESYVTKSGLREIKEEILGAVSGIRDDVRHLGTRIDAMHESQTKPRPRRAAGE